MAQIPQSRSVACIRPARRLVAAVSVLASVVALGPRAALAEEQPKPRAERLFNEALSLARAGQCSRARDKFAQSYASDPAPGTLINWALCEEKAGRPATALRLLELARQLMPAEHPQRPRLEKHLRALSARLGILRLRGANALPAGTVVVRDGAVVDLSLASSVEAEPVDPGVHRVEVHAPGHHDRTYEVLVKEGGSFDLQLETGLPVAISAAPQVAPDDRGGGPGARLLGWTLGGVGVAAIAAGTITGILAQNRWGEVRADCNIDTRQCSTNEGVEAASSGRALATASTVVFASGGVALAGAVYLLLFHGRQLHQASPVHPAPLAAPGTVGLELRGRF